ncbi:hypothetical protein COV16_05240 [Candidatus Woesearchaeota archaeon CG10_big_fil_rev_8_21_14_0_10_34_8]|nr:MAG: hypothetical protein COV16_05240 [Candidatus Woesearchaeota archaeon CG10_big_fil_rev_8_21_14_0_10_34_8]
MSQELAHLARLRDLRDRANALKTNRTQATPETTILSEGQYRVAPTCTPGYAPDGTPAYVKTIPLPHNLDPAAEAKELGRIADQVRIGIALTGHTNHVNLMDYNSEGSIHRLYYSVAAGETVETLVGSEALTVDDVLTITHDVATGLAYAHDPNRDGSFRDPIIHGDVTPGNVLYDGQRARIIDHGASLEEISDGGMYTTRFLTPGFGAPEVAAGEGTTRSDVYGLGMLLTYMVTGRKPSTFFDYKNELKRTELEAAVRLRTNNNGIIDLVQRCTQANPTERLTAAQVVDYVTSLQTGAAAEAELAAQVANVPSGVRKGWNVPRIEATHFALAVVYNHDKVEETLGNWVNLNLNKSYSRDEDKIIVLQEYLERESVSARDRTVIETVIGMIRGSESNDEIIGYTLRSDRENPETIFGHTRSELVSLYSAVRKNQRPSIVGDYDNKGVTMEVVLADDKLLSFVESVADLGLSPKDIRWTFDLVYKSSRQEEYGDSHNTEMAEQYLRQIKAGTLDDRITVLRGKYEGNSVVTEALEDPRYLALFMTLEDERLEFEQNGEQGSFSLENYGKDLVNHFGTGVPREWVEKHERWLHYAVGITEGAGIGAVAFAAYGAAMYALGLEPAVQIGLDPTIMDAIANHGVYGIFVGCSVGGVSSWITDKLARWKTRNVYGGDVTRRYDSTQVIDKVQDLLLSTQGTTYETLSDEITSLGTSTSHMLTPQHLAESVKEILSPKEE